MKWEATPLSIATDFGDCADPNLLIVSLVAFFAIAIISTALLVAEICSACEIFRKAGIIKCWKALIPIYNVYLLCIIVWNFKAFIAWIICILAAVISFSIGVFFPNVFIVFGAILIIQLIITMLIVYKLCKAFGHGIGWTIGMIFLQPIFFLMLGFGKSEYISNTNLRW